MKIALLSGKGGAGKTMLSVNLAAAAGHGTYIDCDVEEPNGRIFLRPASVQRRSVCVPLPSFDPEKCTGCRKCVNFCRFHALIYLKGAPMLFPEVCHSCGGCALVCPEGAVTEVPKEVGTLEIGNVDALQVITGELAPGEASGVPIIHEALGLAQGDLTVIDCPPGSACSVMECVKAADFCLLVAEPTAFGFHNLRMVHELVCLFGKPCGVVINKADAPYAPLMDYCQDKNLPIFAQIPYDPRIARSISGGDLLCRTYPQAEEFFRGLLTEIGGMCP